MEKNRALNPQDALELFKKGEVDSALRGIKAYALKNPLDADAHHLMGIILIRKRDFTAAENALKAASQRAPRDPNILYNLGSCLMDAGRPEEAIQAFLKSLSLNPDLANTHNNLGNCHEKLSNFPLAVQSYKKAISIDPSYLNGLLNLSRIFFKLQQYELAIEELNKSLTLSPNNLEALNRRGLCHLSLENNLLAEADFLNAVKIEPSAQEAHLHLGNLKLGQKQYAEAISYYVKCLDIDPKNYDAISNIGVALNALKDYSKALDCLNEAVKLNPKNALLLNNRGVIMRKLKRFDDSILDHIAAVELNPNFADAYLNLGSSLMEIGRNQEAEVSLNQAILLDPNCFGARFDLGLIALKRGNFNDGWSGYEYRWNISDFPSTPLATNLPRWKPANQDQRVLLWGEQGIGDEIMFSRQLPLAQNASKEITVCMNPKLIPIFSRSFEGITFLPFNSTVDEESYDSQLPIGSLGKYLETDIARLSSLPIKTLRADLSLASIIKKRHKQPGKLLCGISWKSGNVDLGKNRSIALSTFANALNSPDITLLNLQYGDVSHEIHDLKNKTGIEVVYEKDADIFNNVDYLASMIEACDLVVSISNVTIHLSGALGKKTWVLLPKIADWRWGEGTNKSYWYPSLELFRQTSQNDWDDVLITLKQKLSSLGTNHF
jgi:tetratricopeptide (TPR) repeat protein